MSYGNDPIDYYDPNRPTGGPGVNVYVVILILGVIAAAAIVVPLALKDWREANFAEKLKAREAEAKLEAEAAFRKREAEMAAEAQVAGRLVTKTEPSIFRAGIARGGPAVVNIANFVRQERLVGPLQGRLEFVQQGEGSGVIVRQDPDKTLYVLTNAHVVASPVDPGRLADRIGVTLQSGRMIMVEVADNVYIDTAVDLAVIKVKSDRIDHVVVAEFANSDHLEVGDWVIAIGSPFGLKQSATVGIVSAKGRDLQRSAELELIQTDAAINPGNSGGPLLDLQGRIVGINTSIFSRSGGSEGIGFAIPSNTAKDTFEQLIQPPHRVARGYLGVVPMDLEEELAERLHVPGGARIDAVADNTPAERAGLEANDVVLAIVTDQQRREIRNAPDLRRTMLSLKPGTRATLEIIRLRDNQGPMKVQVTVGELPPLSSRMFQPRRIPGGRR
ncbi:MAG TPA: trypsin-like peptidase domain-containing protein [Gemmatales bacterium]|nr:trypsin-like peptidase domain-containing protein [Gemmatales bacterium]HMP60418.1 trypsin-like peptidase domain-containing protein [Gemmatales bacterium]